MLHFIVAKNNEEILNSYLLPSIQKIDCTYEFIEGTENIFQKYNKGIEKLKPAIKDDDIIIFSHEDVRILDSNFKEKLEYVFSTKKDIGLVGVVGAKELTENCAWWLNQQEKLLGHIIQENNNLQYHLVKGQIGFSDQLVVVDGLMFAMRGEMINKGLKFEESFNSFHFYDVSICLQVLDMGYKVAVVDILLQHKSPGMNFLSKEWMQSKERFIEIVKNKGYSFPLTYEQFKEKKNKAIFVS